MNLYLIAHKSVAEAMANQPGEYKVRSMVAPDEDTAWAELEVVEQKEGLDLANCKVVGVHPLTFSLA